MKEWEKITDAKLENDDDSEKSPDRVSTDLFEGLFEEDEQRHERQRQPHLRREDHLPRIWSPELVPPDHRVPGPLPSRPNPTGGPAEAPAASEAAAAVVLEIIVEVVAV